MSEHTNIEWADHTFNPWVGCTKVGPPCDHCYAESWAKRAGDPELWQGERRRTTATNWQEPIKWNRRAATAGERRRVFPSLCDPFDNQVPRRWRDDFWHRIEQTLHLDWLLLTKRPQNIPKMLPDPETGVKPWGAGWPNVWLGVSAGNQEEANRNIPILLQVPAAVRFASLEPLLGPIDLDDIVTRNPEGYEDHRSALVCDVAIEDDEEFHGATLDWVIVGGETGPKARPTHPEWARKIRDDCARAGVAFFFKRWGEWALSETPTHWLSPTGVIRPLGDGVWASDIRIAPIRTRAAGRVLDGRTWDEMPGQRQRRQAGTNPSCRFKTTTTRPRANTP